ncbi:hypothetical protein [Ideonella sp.]|uniref:hypothetical protein n=1 Tax=Ideonella sp. TaxID=1929293 RepID=UPI0035AD8012
MDSRPTPPNPLAAEPRFDVFIRLPRGMSPEEAQQRVERAGLTAAQGASICAALRQVPVVQVRKGIDEQRARKTEHQLSLAGLKIEVKRVPTVPHAAANAPMIPDASHEPAETVAAEARAPAAVASPMAALPGDVPVMHFAAAAPAVAPPAPIAPSAPMAPAAKLAPAPPAAAMAEPPRHAPVPPIPSPPPNPPAAAPRQRVEDPEDFEFNLQPEPDEEDTVFSPHSTRPATRPGPETRPAPDRAPPRAGRRSLAPLLWAVALLAVAGAAFVLGRLSLPWMGGADASGNTTQSIDKVLVAVGAPPALAEIAAPSASAALLGSADDGSSGAADSLTQLAKAERAQGRGVTLEQAVAQMQGAKAGAGLLLPGDQLPAKLAQAAASPTSAGPSANGRSNDGAALLPAGLRATLMADMAVQLAEFGQAGRAREVLGRLRSDAVLSGDPAVGGSTQRAEALLLAWSLRDASGPAIDRNIASLRSLVHGIESPVARAALMGRVATVLAKHDNVPDALALACLADAGEAVKSVSDGAQRQTAIDDWLVDTGDLLLSQLARHGRLGRWQQAQSLAGQLDTLAGQARSGYAVLQLQALRARAQDLMGQPSRAEKLLADALKVWAQRGSPAHQAEELRALAARAGDIAQPELFQVTAQLATAADALHGADRARALTHLALMQAEAGEAERFEALKAMLRQSPEASRPEQAGLTAELLVEGELAAARAEQRSGAFGLAEARVRKVAAYLL